MKKTTILIPILALVIASCGGGTTTQTQGGGNATNTATDNATDTAQTTTVKTTVTPTAEEDPNALSTDDLKKIVHIINKNMTGVFEDESKFALSKNGGKIAYDDKHNPGNKLETKFRCYSLKNGGWMIYVATERLADKGHQFSSLGFYGYKDGSEINVDPSLELLDDADGKEPVDEVFQFADQGITITKKTNGETTAAQYNWNGEYMEIIGAEPESDNNPLGMKEYVEKLPANNKDSVYFFDKIIDGSDDWADYFHYYFFPYKNGGYLAVAEHFFKSHWGANTVYETYRYKDGVFKEVKNILPTAPLSQLLDEEKCKEDADAVQKITQMYNANPEQYTTYDFDGTNICLKLELRDAENSEWDDWYYRDFAKDYDKLPIYKWDGEKFVKQQ